MAISSERRREIKQALAEYRTHNHPLAALLFVGDLTLFAACFVALQWTTSWLVWVALLAVQSIIVLRLSILGHDGEGRFRAYSAGSNPTGTVNPWAIHTLKTLGYPVEGYRSKSWSEFA